MARSNEERIAQRFLDAFSHIGFQPQEFAYYITRAGVVYQTILWNVIKNLMKFWALDLEKGNDKGSTEYLRQTIRAQQILDLMESQENLTQQ